MNKYVEYNYAHDYLFIYILLSQKLQQKYYDCMKRASSRIR